MNQKEAVLKYLTTHKQITQWTAAFDLRCLRLSERIRELERDGHKILRRRISKDGKRIMAYSLAYKKVQWATF